ncbi:hypothetical protein RvY_17408 [Ramazzottius varieornatus]|uniref:Uncharacterized protein n=1 Tax=Ramazzottius varieornatus TaxID=947166 RepID=A0A1D1W920_RAMVA|nr:hypothetical protein RvY_17408 [Ramazzottius varieornatus]
MQDSVLTGYEVNPHSGQVLLHEIIRSTLDKAALRLSQLQNYRRSHHTATKTTTACQKLLNTWKPSAADIYQSIILSVNLHNALLRHTCQGYLNNPHEVFRDYLGD